jgi:hypothetical protein
MKTNYDALDKELRDPRKRFIFQGSSEFAVDLADAIRDLRATVQTLSRYRESLSEVIAERDALREALTDMLSGWRYIRETHGDLYGVGWDRAQEKAIAALAAQEKKP